MDSHRRRAKREHPQAGMALLAVLTVLVVVIVSGATFIWFMNRQQERAGARYRSASAFAAAEAGVYRALSILESADSDQRASVQGWRPQAYSGAFVGAPLQGRFTLSVIDQPGGGVLITSTGEAGGVIRRLRVRAFLASPILLAGLHAAGTAQFEAAPSAIAVLPYGPGTQRQAWVHVAAGRGIWLATDGVSFNDPAVAAEGGPGPVDAVQGSPAPVSRSEPVRIVLGPEGELMIGKTQHRIDAHRLSAAIGAASAEILRTTAYPGPLEVDRVFFRSQAARNTANAALNAAAGQYAGDADLARKDDSFYTAGQFAQLQAYLKTRGQVARLRGVIYIRGGAAFLERQRMEIADGALITENTVHLAEGAVLEITHSPGTRSLPGLLVLNKGALVITQRARLRVHGFVFVSRVIDIGTEALLDVVGAVAAGDPGLGFRNTAGKVLIRYDSAVLGTPGLRPSRDDPVIAWVAGWEEVP